ncbi:MAG: DUF4406 domain-containing protein [Candidatus Amulumruptor caecigallinarius]|nr:DUF4406 domain-containing protein [Candidatus Amulumruptor caecigallinarius]
MKIYISVPITGRERKDFTGHSDRVKAALSRQGHVPVSPLDVYAGRKPSYEDYICCDLRAMLDCDAVFFCEGWEQSCGCNIEHDVAMRFKAHGKKDFRIMYE